MMRSRVDRPRASAAGVTALAVVLAGCGGEATPTDPSGSATGSASPKPSAQVSATSAARPEGPWTIVAWTVKRSDGPSEQRPARTILASFKPTCASGPCDLTVSPAGSNGTYREPEAPPRPGDTPSTDPITLTWNGNSYGGHTKERVVPCTPAQGPDVPQGYRMMTTWSLTFLPPADGGPARAHGTIVDAVTGTKASRAKGCTDFTETEAFGGVPTGSLEQKTAPAGQYDASMSSTASTPKGLAPVGRVLWLGTMSASGAADGPTITGLTKSTGALASGSDGWGVATPTAPSDCRAADGSAAPKGADGSETFAALHPVALTEEGAAIFAGTWRLRANPNDVGRAAGCTLAVYDGRLLLVPSGAGG